MIKYQFITLRKEIIKIIILGIVGGSGVGKSKICEYLYDEYNASIIDADKVGHEVTEYNINCINEIINYFGNSILYDNLSKTINRKLLGNIVFNDINELRKLNEITHKYIVKQILHYINLFKSYKSKLCVLDCALLLDTELKDLCTDIWIVDADINIRMERIMERDNISEEYALSRINSLQINIPLKYAEKVIYNNNDFNDTIYYIDKHIKELLIKDEISNLCR